MGSLDARSSKDFPAPQYGRAKSDADYDANANNPPLASDIVQCRTRVAPKGVNPECEFLPTQRPGSGRSLNKWIRTIRSDRTNCIPTMHRRFPPPNIINDRKSLATYQDRKQVGILFAHE